MKLRKEFNPDREVPQYYVIAATSSTGYAHDDEDLQSLLNFYEIKEIDVRVYKLDQDLRFSHPEYSADAP